MPVIGFLSYGSAEYDAAASLPAFRQGLGEIGYVEGGTSQSNTAGPNFNMNGCRRWRRIWFGIQ
jgi:hypothetical protein